MLTGLIQAFLSCLITGDVMECAELLNEIVAEATVSQEKKEYTIGIVGFPEALYIPKVVAYAQDKAEQRKINQQILDLELELEDVKSEWKTLDSDKIDYIGQIETLSGYVAEIQSEQDNLHKRADEIRKAIDELKGVNSLNDDIVNCYQWTGDLYNDCLDAIIYVQTGGL